MSFAPQKKPVVQPLTEPAAASPLVNSSAFDLPGRGRAAALCLHGLTGTPYEVRPLAEAISAVGIRAVGPALPGHNETPERLAATSHKEWLEAARAQFRRLREGNQRPRRYAGLDDSPGGQARVGGAHCRRER